MNDNVRWLRRRALSLVAVLGACAAAQTEPTMPPPVMVVELVEAGPPRDMVLDTVQIAVLLDTSNSMDGLINQARSQLWNMVDRLGGMTRVVEGKLRGVKLELALYEYGNASIPVSVGYIRQVLPFTSDLDRVAEQLHNLFTNGGEEYAGQAIVTAVDKLKWSTSPDELRFIFVAGNETFIQGPIGPDAAMSAAAKKGIHVQLIYCGAHDSSWEAAARSAKSDLVSIDQDHVAVHVPAPQDDEILRLSAQLNATYLAYGDDAAVSTERQSKADMSSAKMGKKVAVERAQLKSKPGKYSNEKWDLVDAHAKNAKVLEQTRDDKLPPEMRGKPLAEKQKILAAKVKEREDLQAKIGKLEAERVRHIEAERTKQKGPKVQSLETELVKATTKAATTKGYKL